MASIKPLPEALRSSLRSGVFLFDFTRVVEELVFNSLDARATKVSVFVSTGSCYLKVVDDGSGITRDGLQLVGERYATSKFLNLVDLNAASENFGFRGEALASISEVSLLEIVTRTYGRPNGYRKVLKGCKCLYLGIDDDRKEVGTTGHASIGSVYDPSTPQPKGMCVLHRSRFFFMGKFPDFYKSIFYCFPFSQTRGKILEAGFADIIFAESIP